MNSTSFKLHNFGVKSLQAAAAFAALTTFSHAASPVPGTDHATAAKAWASYGRIPLSFEANKGQSDSQVDFLARGAGYSLFLRPTEATLQLKDSVLRMRLVAANAAATPQPKQPLPGSINYMRGNDAGRWTTDVTAYERVAYEGVYPGVDLVYYGNQQQLEYDFVVAPGADASRIVMSFEGAAPRVDARGDLVLAAAGSETRFHKPVVYQTIGDKRVTIDAKYQTSNAKVRFALGSYDHRKPLVIDPILSYSTYLGGSGSDYVGNTSQQGSYGAIQNRGIAVDASGSVYLAGSTYSTDYPLKNAYQSKPKQLSGYPTVFITKLNPTGTAIVYSTFLGGTVFDQAYAVAVDTAGSAYVVGSTHSPDFPVTAGAFQQLCSPALVNNAIVSNCGYEGSANTFVTKLSADGKSLVYSTFLGGDDSGGGDGGYAITLDSKNQAYVVGYSDDSCGGGGEQSYYCFPTTAGAFVSGAENSHADFTGINQGEGYLSVLNAAGSGLLYSTLMTHPVKNSNFINAVGVALDPAGNIYVTGETYSGDLSTTAGAYQTTTGPVSPNSPPGLHQIPSPRAYVAKFSPVGTSTPKLSYLTYLGGTTTNGGNVPTGIAVDAAGNAYILNNESLETDLPTTAGAYSTDCSANRAYLAKLNPTGSALVWGTCFGNPAGQTAETSSLALDAKGNIYIAVTGDSTLPEVNPVVTTPGGEQAFVVEFNPTASRILFSTPLGGPLGGLFAGGIVLDRLGAVYVTGQTYNADLPVTPGVVQATYAGGGWDSFVSKIIVPTSAAADSSALGTETNFLGEAKSSFTVWRPSSGFWYSNDGTGKVTAAAFGAATDLPVIGDFDGDGVTDLAVYRPSTGYWYIEQSSNDTVVAKQFGASTDIPVAGDFDGDGKTDLAVFRPSTGFWYITESKTDTVVAKQFGASTDTPVVGDFDGDGKTDLAVFRASTGYWYVTESSNNTVVATQWGASTDIPVSGDFDGDGKTDIAVYRPSTGYWYIILSSTGATVATHWGQSGDVPVPRDYDGDGKTDIAVWRPSTGYWYVIDSYTGLTSALPWGASTDIPVNNLGR